MKHRYFIILLCLLNGIVYPIFARDDYAMKVEHDTTEVTKSVLMPEIVVSAGRVGQRSSVTYTNMDANEISKNHTVTDLPLVLNTIPNLFSYSEAGSLMGYSYLRLRGFDQSKVAVLVNGMPLNDPESHFVYWVDLPDIASSAQDIQVQRGAGQSGLGFSPFGGAINIATLQSSPWNLKLEMGYGNWNTRKRSIQYYSGLINNQWSFIGRYSKLNSDGYRDDSWSELWSAYLSIIRKHSKGEDQFNVILGNERLHLAYYGVPIDSIYARSKYNPLTAPIPQTDQFYQPHYQWVNSFQISENIKYEHTFYLSQGKGSYVQWKPQTRLSRYGLGPFTVRSSSGTDSTISKADLITEKWVAMEQIGYFPSLHLKNEMGDWIGDVEIRKNVASHWGVVNWANLVPPDAEPTPEWYRWRSVKEYLGLGLRADIKLTDHLMFSPSVTSRYISYSIDQRVGRNVQLYPGHNTQANWFFFLPKIGLTFERPEVNLISRFSISKSAREPNQSQLFEASDGVPPNFKKNNGRYWEDPIAKPEELTSIELGVKWLPNPKVFLDVAIYHHLFQNEIVPIGGLNELGEPIVGNAKSSYQTGIEIEGAVQLNPQLVWKGNISAAQAKFSDFTVYDQQLDANWDPVNTVATKLDGNDVPYVPKMITNSTFEYNLKQLTIWTSTRYVGKIPMNMRGDKKLVQPPYSTTGIGVQYNVNISKELQLTFDTRVNNVFDRKYAAGGYFYEYPSPDGVVQVVDYFPGTPRNYWLGVSIKL
ncbi:MAG: TonB-dependent receptor plug domain-containing protein [bacterium]|nr:TonB-dependent receptor plug domain-containing protein [bacterium]